VLLAGAAAVLVVVLVLGSPHPTSSDHRFVVPAGTAERVARGEDVSIVPDRLFLRVGDTITLVNDDDVVQQAGFLAVGPHETLTYRFRRPGSYVSACTLHAGGSLQVVVSS